MRRASSSVLGLVVLLALILPGVARALPDGGCPIVGGASCGVNPKAGDFQGLIAVRDAPWVLDLAGHSGTTPGCGDCSWSIVLACATESPGESGTQHACTGASESGACPPGQLLYRLYLSTTTIVNQIVGTLCLGGRHQPIPIGLRAAGDVQRYLKDLVPPNLVITTSPVGATLAGLTTYFAARTPTALEPVPFQGREITETITIAPSRTDWHWGDGSVSGWATAATTTSHAFVRGGNAAVALAVRWGATYTITFEGQTVGPYPATGRLTKRQSLALPVDTSTPTLVSR